MRQHENKHSKSQEAEEKIKSDNITLVRTTTGKELLNGLAERQAVRKKLYAERQEQYW